MATKALQVYEKAEPTLGIKRPPQLLVCYPDSLLYIIICLRCLQEASVWQLWVRACLSLSLQVWTQTSQWVPKLAGTNLGGNSKAEVGSSRAA